LILQKVFRRGVEAAHDGGVDVAALPREDRPLFVVVLRERGRAQEQ